MGEQTRRKADPGGPGIGAMREPVSKVAAWIREARFNRSLIGPGAHSAAYRHLIGAQDHQDDEPRPRPLPARPVMTEPGPESSERQEAPEAVAEPAEAAPAPEPVRRPRRSPPRRIAPRGRRPRHAPRQRTTLFAVSAIAALFVSAPFGYWAYDMVDAELPLAGQSSQAEAESPEAKAPAPTAAPDLAAARAAVAPVRSASLPDKRESLTVTEVAKEESEEPYRALIQEATLEAPAAEAGRQTATEALAVADPAAVETAARAAKLPDAEAPASRLPEPDPRAAALLEQGESLVEQGEIASARRFFERAGELGEPKAFMQLARTYDPVVLEELKVVGLKAEPDKAVELYERARALMSDGKQAGRAGSAASLTR